MLTDWMARGPPPALVDRRTALIVEDDPRLQKRMGKHLSLAGFQVLSALHYDAAVSHLRAREAHLVCVDVGLPEKSGYELCEYIRGPLGLTLVPIIVTCEHGHSQEMAFAEAAGANAFLCKPFSRRQLAICVESLLDRTPWSTPPVHELVRFAPFVAAGHADQRLFAPARVMDQHGGRKVARAAQTHVAASRRIGTALRFGSLGNAGALVIPRPGATAIPLVRPLATSLLPRVVKVGA